MSKSDLIAPLNINALARALTDNAKAGKDGVFRHKGFLDLIAQSQGFANFKAFSAQPLTTSVPSQSASAPTEKTVAITLHQKVNHQWVQSPGTLNLNTLAVVQSNDALLEAAEVRAEYISMGTRLYHVIRHPQSQVISFALGSFDDYCQAVAPQMAVVADKSVFEFQYGLLSYYGVDGDWHCEVGQVFEDLDILEQYGDEFEDCLGEEDINGRLRFCNFWHADCKDIDGELYEFYINPLEWLFVQVQDEKTVVLPTQEIRISALR